MNDLEFIRRCIERDKAAWEEFLRKYSNLIYNYIHSVLKIKGQDLSQDTIGDLFQDIIFSLIKDDCRKLKIFKAKNGCSFASWLRIVTINFTIDYIRKLKPAISLEADLEGVRPLKDRLSDNSYSGLEQELVEGEKQKQLSECIDELNIEDKYFLKFHINKGVSLDKLSTMLGLSKPAVEMRKSRIIQRLKNCFKKKGFLLDS